MIHKDESFFQYNNRHLVYIISSLASQLIRSLRKVATMYIGSIVLCNSIDPHNYLLMTVNGKILRDYLYMKDQS